MALEPGQALFCKSRATPFRRGPRVGLYARYAVLSKQTRKHLYHICTMLDQRRRRWANVVQMLYKCFLRCIDKPADTRRSTKVILRLGQRRPTVDQH